MAGLLKKSTGLVGLAVDSNPHESPKMSERMERKHLRILYTKLTAVLQNIPKDAAYRKYTEAMINERLNMVKTEPDVQKLENKINDGQIEEVILQAENELNLARKMAQWKPWEPLIEDPPSDQWKWPV
ncbi:NADH dehydrogenase [ubiquinone] 1 alpha subcomplex subunit 5 isoform X1 [Alligator mississippiensis]|uniref:NADH dehydrogenase [ubiquinone] 1 alpha subcomplex subunit 5 isoform X1 n=1 Tax=Alligator mississippiensis TaxID=8496 RepID=UPI00090734F3|nr:NADH dehydrogenase [ubiquinone] 1 alpha subcomplex subunit 5 isoform X1 [Alligator mississippiensis]